MDFLAGDPDLDLTGASWSMTSVDLDLSAQELADAPSSIGMVSASYTDLPADMPPLIRQLANQVTAGAPTRFQKAVALQDWFREEFDYSLRNVPPGNGTDRARGVPEPARATTPAPATASSSPAPWP